jgi:hypothetical protein
MVRSRNVNHMTSTFGRFVIAIRSLRMKFKNGGMKTNEQQTFYHTGRLVVMG